MSTRHRIPPALEPYLCLPPELSLVLLTSTLGCSANWVTARFVSSVLQGRRDDAVDTGGASGSRIAVILVSWMRDLTFWRSEIRRTTGVDVSAEACKGLFTFVDCLASDASSKNVLADLEKNISAAIEGLRRAEGTDIVLVLDQPDLLLATASATSQQLSQTVFKLRAMVHSTIVHCSADLPMLAAATQPPDQLPLPIEAETAAFTVQQSHAARFVMSVRELDTGSARDVSGVLRVTRGGSAYGAGSAGEEQVQELEALYLVQRDGIAKVFQRGAVGGS